MSNSPQLNQNGTTQLFDFSAESYLGKQIFNCHNYKKRTIENQPQHPHIDALIVGAGPAGLVCASVLAAAGMTVVIVESGSFWPRGTFKRNQQWAFKNLYQAHGSWISKGTPFIPIMAGRGVGGGTLVNSGISFRTPRRILELWRDEDGVDMLLNHPELFEEVERTIGVTPTSPAIAGVNSAVAKRGFEALGLRHEYMPRNAANCEGCGTCQTGCPVNGKASADLNWLPLALRDGAILYANTHVDRLLLRDDGGKPRVYGIEGKMRYADPRKDYLDSKEGSPVARMQLTADRVIVAAGTIATSALLQRSGIKDPNLGEHLHVHPGGGIAGKMSHNVHIWFGAAQGYFAYHPSDPDVLMETFTAPAEGFFTQYADIGATDEFMKYFKELAAVGFLIRDESPGGVKWEDGEIKVTFDLSDQDREKFLHGLDLGIEMMFAAGAKEVRPSVVGAYWFKSIYDWKYLRSRHAPTSRLLLYASHPTGTCRLSEDRTRGVVSPEDGSVYAASGLHIVDASLMPTAPGVNPQITIMAQSLGLSRRICSL